MGVESFFSPNEREQAAAGGAALCGGLGVFGDVRVSALWYVPHLRLKVLVCVPLSRVASAGPRVLLRCTAHHGAAATAAAHWGYMVARSHRVGTFYIFPVVACSSPRRVCFCHREQAKGLSFDFRFE